MKLIHFVLAAGSVAAAAGGAYLYREKLEAATPPAPVAAPVDVRVAAAARATMTDAYVAFGEFRAHRTVDLPARAGGQLTQLLVAEGQRVKAGDLVAQVDDTLAKANLANGQTLLDLAQAKYDRIAKLSGSGVTSAAALDDAKAALISAESQLELNRSQLDFLKVRAPFDGIVASLPPPVGSYVQTGQTVAKLIDPSALEAEFSVPFDLVGTIQTGSRFKVQAIGPVQWSAEATVSAIDPEVERTTRTLRLRGRLANADFKIRPGSVARIELIVAERPDAVTVPEPAVMTSLAGSFVYKVVDGRAVRTAVTIGARRNGVVEITAGVAAGDAVVTDGRQKVQQGTPVRVAAAEAAGA